MDNLRAKISYILDTRKGHRLGDVADAILALPEIAELQKKLAEVERQHTLDVIDAVNAQARAEAAEAVVEQLTNDPAYVAVYRAGYDDGKDKLATQVGYKEDYRAAYTETLNDLHRANTAIPRAYQMGLDDAANRLEPKNPRDDWTDFAKQHHADAIEIRAMQPPADLLERVAITQEWDRVMKGTDHE